MTITSRFLPYLDFRNYSRRKQVHFMINIGVGILIAVLFHFLEQTKWGENTLNLAFDHVIRGEAQKWAAMAAPGQNSKPEEIFRQVAFIHFDEETYSRLGKPLITPRVELAKVINMLSNKKAKVIVLDMVLENEDCCHPEGDQQLRRVLEEMIGRQDETMIIFSSGIGPKGELKKGIYDDLIKRNPRFFKAVPTLAATATDKVIRYWRPFEILKEGNKKIVLWNSALLASGLYHDQGAGFEQMEAGILTNGRGHKATLDLAHGKRIIFSLDQKDLYLYRIRFTLIPANVMEDYPGGNLFENIYTPAEAAHGSFRDKIVIIGNSSIDAGDYFPTPIGYMSGMFIIGNALNTITHGRQPTRSPWWVNLFIEAVIIVGAAYFFLYFTSLFAQAISSILLIVTLGVFSYFLFQHTGVFLNFVFAVVGMSLHRVISDMEDVIERKGRNVSQQSVAMEEGPR
jgi:hypothetical protein